MSDAIYIGVTDCSKYAVYSTWIRSYGPQVNVTQLGAKQQNLADLERCSGILLTGGEDVHPRFYNKPEYYSYCYAEDIDEERDTFEWEVLAFSQSHSIPLLGICRGLQIGNAYFGGTLVPDIPAWGKFSHAKLPGGKDRYHSIQVDPDSWLHGIVGRTEGIVNSNHHQSADRIGTGLVASAISPDGIAEALERADPTGKPFLCLVQWHPERMTDQQSPFTAALRKAFMEASGAKKEK